MDRSGKRFVVVGGNPMPEIVVYKDGSTNYQLTIEDKKAFGLTLQAAYDNGFVVKGARAESSTPAFSEYASTIIKYATR